MERRLVAILAADVVGYSRLMGEDDLTDAGWALIAPHTPAPNRLGRPCKTVLRGVVNAILYVLRSGCPWSMLTNDSPSSGECRPKG